MTDHPFGIFTHVDTLLDGDGTTRAFFTRPVFRTAADGLRRKSFRYQVDDDILTVDILPEDAPDAPLIHRLAAACARQGKAIEFAATEDGQVTASREGDGG